MSKPLAPSRRTFVTTALAAGVAAPALLRGTSAFAQYPDRPVRIVVANTPGGPSDITARIVAAQLQQNTGKTFIVENRGGAGGNIGFGYAAKADPDGYTILLITNAFSVNVTLYHERPYKVSDFVGVSELAVSPNTFTVKSDLPAKTMKEFVALVRANPTKYNCATPPIGTSSQLQLAYLKHLENLPQLSDVVYKGGGDAITALLGGDVQISSGSLAPALPHIKAGTMRCLAITGDQRWPEMPEVPTMVEAGYKDFVFGVDCALLAPATTPPEAVKWLEAETLKVMKNPQIQEKLHKAGFVIRTQGADACWKRVNKEIVLFKEIIETAKIAKL
jgi:tripartite-type tricarboxylate transporter receptor subunit TctC